MTLKNASLNLEHTLLTLSVEQLPCIFETPCNSPVAVVHFEFVFAFLEADAEAEAEAHAEASMDAEAEVEMEAEEELRNASTQVRVWENIPVFSVEV